MVVERQLNAAGQSRRDLGRDAFVAKVWEWKATSGGPIARQMRRLGASVDWTRDKFTMDPELSAAVTEAFVRLHRDGSIYRGKRLVNWDPVLKTALSDLEVARRGGSAPLASEVSAARRRRPPDRGDHPAGNHAGRYGGRGASRR